MERASYFSVMVIDMWVNSRKMSTMGRESLSIRMEVTAKGIFKRTISMDL